MVLGALLEIALNKLIAPRLERNLYLYNLLLTKHNITACRSPRVFRRTAVLFAVSGSVLAAAAWTTNEMEYRWWYRAVRPIEGDLLGGSKKLPDASPVQVREQEHIDAIKRFRQRLTAILPERLSGLVAYPEMWLTRVAKMNDIDRFVAIVAAINVSIYAISRSTKGFIGITTRLAHAGLSGKTYAIFTAPFVHLGVFHLTSNTFALLCCYPGYWHLEQEDNHSNWAMPLPKLLAFYVIAGGVSMYTPTLWAVTTQRHLLRSLPTNAKAYAEFPASYPTGLGVVVGGSGALMALLTLTLLPENVPIKIGPISFTSHQSWWATLATDLLLMKAFPMVAVAGHFSGVGFGLAYMYGGQTVWNWARDAVGNRNTRTRVDLQDGRPFYHFGITRREVESTDK